MSHHKELCQWRGVVSSHLEKLSWNQVKVLAEYSYGMVMTQQSGLSRIAKYLGQVEQAQENTVRQRLREWCYDAPDKRGRGRQEVEVAACFEGLLGWVVSWWRSGERQIVLALDATSLGQVFTVLVLSVMYRGCSIPVAWAIVGGTQQGSWQAHWLGMLALAHRAIPRKWRVVVLTDRGLYAKWLFAAIRGYRWHPFMRINTQGQYRLRCSQTWHPLSALVRQDGKLVARRIVCFKTPSAQLTCCVLGYWYPVFKDPWLIVTDLPLNQASALWYGWRTWIECGFKDFKRGGWRWEQTKMTRPERAERLWLIMSVATLWVLSVGGEADALAADPAFLDKPKPRSLSCFVLGLITIRAALDTRFHLPFGRFIPDYCSKAPT
jgi:hypothetical protein